MLRSSNSIVEEDETGDDDEEVSRETGLIKNPHDSSLAVTTPR